MRNVQDTFETCKRSIITAFSIFMTVPLNQIAGSKNNDSFRPVEMKKILGGLPIKKYCQPPWLADEENFSFQIV